MSITKHPDTNGPTTEPQTATANGMTALFIQNMITDGLIAVYRCYTYNVVKENASTLTF